MNLCILKTELFAIPFSPVCMSKGEMGLKGERGVSGKRGPTGRPGKRGKQVSIYEHIKSRVGTLTR